MVDRKINKKITYNAPPNNSATSVGANPTTAAPNRKARKKKKNKT